MCWKLTSVLEWACPSICWCQVDKVIKSCLAWFFMFAKFSILEVVIIQRDVPQAMDHSMVLTPQETINPTIEGMLWLVILWFLLQRFEVLVFLKCLLFWHKLSRRSLSPLQVHNGRNVVRNFNVALPISSMDRRNFSILLQWEVQVH